jgi:hypothetical protein
MLSALLDQSSPNCAPAPSDCPPGDARKIADSLRSIFVGPGEVCELRVIRKDNTVTSGFFDHGHLDEMAQRGLHLSLAAGTKGAYFTLNPLKPGVLTRGGPANQLRKARTGMSARAADVARRRWLFVDGDPTRPSDCSATDAEKALARARVLLVRDYLTGLGWPLPVLADSGNGFHLLYLIDLPADDGDLVKRVLRTLAKRFNDKDVEIDAKVHDAPRITKLYGSKACKGADTPERPPSGLSPWGASGSRAGRSPSAPGDSGASGCGAPSRGPTRGSTIRRRPRGGCVASRSRAAPPPRWSSCQCRRRRLQKRRARPGCLVRRSM